MRTRSPQMKFDKKQRVIYYKDELNDDFGEVGLSRPAIPENYKYIRSGVGKFFSDALYYLIAYPILRVFCLFAGVRIKGKKKLKPLKKGYFLYGNHTGLIDAITPAVMIASPKRANIVAYTDAMTIPVARRVLKPLGYMPVSDKLSDLKKLYKAIDYYLEHKQCIAIYPEAHIWPYYTGVRKFLSTSFRYPAKAGAPVVPFFSTFRKSKFSEKPKMTINIGDPIYPDPSLSVAENTERFAKMTYEYMLNCSATLPNYEYIKYIKSDEQDETPSPYNENI